MARRLAVDLLWVRHKQVGGIEAYICNLLDGLMSLDEDFELFLLVSRDNREVFEHYAQDERYHIVECNLESRRVAQRILWQNFQLGKIIKKLGLDVCFEPYYCKPFFGVHKIKFITTIHDLQALHYPQYFSKFKVLWMKKSWKNAVKTSKKIVAISKYVKNDIIENYKIDSEKVQVIYNPILIKNNELESAEVIEQKYGVKRERFYFTVSSLLPHKNITTLIKVFSKIKTANIALPCKLIISGIGGKSKEELVLQIEREGLQSNIILTSFIDNAERNALYKYCKAFLFPSVFEGFGMPPIEAMYFGVPVITTRKACLEEVTQGKANYVNDPFDVDEWIDIMKECKAGQCDLSIYDKTKIAEQYLKLFKDN